MDTSGIFLPGILVHLLVIITSLVFFHCVFAASNPLASQTQALLALKSGFVDSHGHLHDWNLSNQDSGSPCSWTGVTCDRSLSKVVALDLSQKNLAGVISDRIQELQHLVDLNISKNSFTEQFPASIFNLTRLRTLDISHNNFNGSFPAGISKVERLQIFNAFSNSFTGPLPVEFARLSSLQELNLAGSYFEGSIPAEYGSFGSNLRFLHLAGNLITGSIPPELGRLQSLRHMEIGYNRYSGGIPRELGNMTALEYLDIAGASLSGFLPAELGNLKKLNSMFIFRNFLRGSIPPELSNITGLESLDLSDNLLTGPIPESFTKLKKLNLLSLMCNKMSGTVPEGMADLRNLESFLIWNNSFSGRLPERLGRDSNLVWLDVSTNNFTGPVPPDLCAQGVLFKLILFSNGFEGEIPYSLARCRSLYRLRMADNRLSGSIPRGLLGMLPNLTFADLSMNNLTGGIPAELIDSPRLQYLNFSHNPLGGRLPEKIWSAPGLHVFSASFANLSGKLPAFTKRNSLQILQLQGNALSGSIPRDIIHCQKLARLELGHNEITGLIPAQLASIPEINSIELSYNELAGTIPAEFNNCSSLKFFNVSYNDLSGQVPSGGVFQHISASAFAGNQFLCGGVLGACVNLSHGASQDSNRRPRTKPGALVWVMGAGFTVSVFIVIIGTHYYKRYRTRSRGISQRADPYQAQGTHPLYIEEGTWKMTAFGRLAFTVEDVLKSMKSTNIIGNGPLSTVYKAEMPGGDTIAIKKLQLEQRLNQDTLQELDAMGKARHRNILRLLGFCHNNEHSLIFLYEFMPNGSLVGQYHNKKEFGWATRYQIAEGIAHGLCYLHHDCNPPIVHGVLKPSNVLLDGHMEPQLSDFCMAKLPDDAMCSTAYISPEHEPLRDEKSDIYSFGVILLELLTGMSAVDSEGVSIVDLVRAKCTEIRRTEGSLMDILDKNMNMQPAVKENQAMMLLHVALLCTNRRPFDRPSMRDVVSMLSEKKPLRKTVMDFHSSLTQGSTSAFPM